MANQHSKRPNETDNEEQSTPRRTIRQRVDDLVTSQGNRVSVTYGGEVNVDSTVGPAPEPLMTPRLPFDVMLEIAQYIRSYRVRALLYQEMGLNTSQIANAFNIENERASTVPGYDTLRLSWEAFRVLDFPDQCQLADVSQARVDAIRNNPLVDSWPVVQRSIADLESAILRLQMMAGRVGRRLRSQRLLLTSDHEDNLVQPTINYIEMLATMEAMVELMIQPLNDIDSPPHSDDELDEEL